jgi:hypothetical protein
MGAMRMRRIGSEWIMQKTYDQQYFDKWYRDPRHAVASRAELKRKVAMVVAQAEYYLGRPLRSALDVGCGRPR